MTICAVWCGRGVTRNWLDIGRSSLRGGSVPKIMNILNYSRIWWSLNLTLICKYKPKIINFLSLAYFDVYNNYVL